MNEKERKLEELKNESILHYDAEGSTGYDVLLILVAVVAFVIVLTLLLQGRSRTSAIGIFLVAMFPAAVGLLAMVDLIVGGFRVIEQSGTDPNPAVICGSLAYAMDRFSYGIKLSIPSVLMAIWSMVRSPRTVKRRIVAGDIAVNPPSPTAG